MSKRKTRHRHNPQHTATPGRRTPAAVRRIGDSLLDASRAALAAAGDGDLAAETLTAFFLDCLSTCMALEPDAARVNAVLIQVGCPARALNDAAIAEILATAELEAGAIRH